MNQDSRRGNKPSSFSLIAVALLSLSAITRADVTIFVAPTGNDAWSGNRAEPDANKSDGPVATPAHARDLARAAHARDPGQAISIQLRGGMYFLAEPLVLTPQDSGSEKSPVVWEAYKDEKPILDGGRRITGWQKTTVNGHDAWMAKLPAGDGAFFFRELWINGKLAQRARWPKAGTLAVAEMPKAKNHAEWRAPASAFYFHPGDVKAWPGGTDGEVVMMSRWVESRLPITAIDEKDSGIHFGKPAGFTPETADRYYIENVKQCLTDPGEWYLDAKENTVYLIPPAGVASPADADIIAPSLPEILRLNGDVAAKKWIENVQFRGITFSHNQWYYDHVAKGQNPEPQRTGYNQAAVGVPGAIVADSIRSCVFDHCNIEHAGSYGIQLGRACQHNRITHCTLTDLAAGGIKLGETAIRDNADEQAFDNEISDCRITDGGNLFPSGVGVWIGQSHDNTIAHNEIGRFWYTGISVGWTWGYSKALSQNNRIEANEIHHIGIKADGDAPILSDMGGIYTLGNEKGTTIRNNVFHDIGAIKYGGWGIYFDEGTTDILAENNLVYRTTHGGFHQHYGKDNIVRNNIFALGRDMQIQRTRLEDHTSFTFENNIVYWKTGVLLTGNWQKFNVKFDHNTYWKQGGGEFKFDKFTWKQWRDAGMDVHSQIADPGFKDPEHGDFHFKAKPPEGFKPFDTSEVGPRK
ncbi:MAG TPA: right-handed parallel beta-helix repeat-containing protein [Tepidisphaeraceae bacterium]|jgi:hypothetical protein|nr:right-handed parallel beta-helix repeat-containing protein [Tepidisphaeraceae bacterium]